MASRTIKIGYIASSIRMIKSILSRSPTPQNPTPQNCNYDQSVHAAHSNDEQTSAYFSPILIQSVLEMNT